MPVCSSGMTPEISLTKVGVMALTRTLTSAAVTLASFGLVLPQPVLAQAPAGVRSASTPAVVAPISDVQLHQGGTLMGQVVNADGAPLKGTIVHVQQGGAQVATITTNESGFFQANHLHGGIYQVAAADGYGTYRMWAPNTAPPAAKPGLLLISGSPVVRGQEHGYVYWLTNPWVLAGLIGAAITVPIALNNDDDSSS